MLSDPPLAQHRNFRGGPAARRVSGSLALDAPAVTVLAWNMPERGTRVSVAGGIERNQILSGRSRRMP